MEEKQLSSIQLAIRMIYESPVADELCDALKKLCFADLGKDYLRKRISELESVNAALKNSLETKGILAAGLHIERLTFAVAALEKEKLELLDRLVRLEAENANLKIADNKNHEHWFGHKIKTFIWKK